MSDFFAEPNRAKFHSVAHKTNVLTGFIFIVIRMGFNEKSTIFPGFFYSFGRFVWVFCIIFFWKCPIQTFETKTIQYFYTSLIMQILCMLYFLLPYQIIFSKYTHRLKKKKTESLNEYSPIFNSSVFLGERSVERAQDWDGYLTGRFMSLGDFIARIQ